MHFAIPARAQDQALADSLIEVVSSRELLSDSAKYVLYVEIAAASINPSQIIDYSTKAITIAKEKKLNVSYGAAMLYKGEGYMHTGDLVKALECHFRAAELYEQSGNLTGVATAYDYIGRAYAQQNHQPLAVHYFKKSIDIFQSKNDADRIASSLLNLGYYYLKAQKADTALLYTTRADSIFIQLKHEVGHAYAIGNSGLMYAALQQDQLAEAKLQEAIELLQKYQDHLAIAEYLIEMGSIYQGRSLHLEALQYARSAHSLAKANDFKEYIRDASKTIAELYAQLNNFEAAYAYQKEYLLYRDSLNNEETIRKMADLQLEYELAQKQRNIEDLQEDKRVQQLQVIGLIFIVLLACVLVFVLFLYIRHKHQSNRKLEQQNSELERLINTRNRFFSIISHDLRGPVNAFNGISGLIRHYIAGNDLKQLAEVSEYIDKSASQLSVLLDNLLSWSVLQQSEFPYTPEKISLETLLNETKAIFVTMAHAKNIQLQTYVKEEIHLLADSNSMLTILRNLTSNALKFTHAGGTVTISAKSRDGMAEIQVADTGIGMSQQRLDSLFVLREEKRTWGTSGEKGLGIGLRLAFDFAKMNKGTIEVSSQEGVGTAFLVKIPLWISQPSGLADKTHSPKA